MSKAISIVLIGENHRDPAACWLIYKQLIECNSKGIKTAVCMEQDSSQDISTYNNNNKACQESNNHYLEFPNIRAFLISDKEHSMEYFKNTAQADEDLFRAIRSLGFNPNQSQLLSQQLNRYASTEWKIKLGSS